MCIFVAACIQIVLFGSVDTPIKWLVYSHEAVGRLTWSDVDHEVRVGDGIVPLLSGFFCSVS